MATRLFVSFDFDHDQFLRDALVQQARNPDSPFDVVDYSLRDPFVGNWQEKVRLRIRQVGQVAVLCGHHTHTARGVAAELRIAREELKPYFLLRGYNDPPIYKPTSALATDTIYDWTWPNLKLLVAGRR